MSKISTCSHPWNCSMYSEIIDLISKSTYVIRLTKHARLAKFPFSCLLKSSSNSVSRYFYRLEQINIPILKYKINWFSSLFNASRIVLLFVLRCSNYREHRFPDIASIFTMCVYHFHKTLFWELGYFDSFLSEI